MCPLEDYEAGECPYVAPRVHGRRSVRIEEQYQSDWACIVVATSDLSWRRREPRRQRRIMQVHGANDTGTARRNELVKCETE